jgi:hypothetical protein
MANQSGTSETPTLLVYPDLLKFDEFEGIKGMFCYIIEHYGDDGIACLVARDPKEDKILIQCGDWKGTIHDLADEKSPQAEISKQFLNAYGEKLLSMMKLAQIDQAIFYLTINSGGKFKLVDVRISFNKFLGPGMLRDVFSALIETPKVLDIANITDDVKDAMLAGNGKFSGNLILKPSRFRDVTWNGKSSPLYVEIVR